MGKMTMKTVSALAIAAIATAIALPSNAAIYEITVRGTLIEQLAVGTLPGLDVGDVLTMTTRFDSSRISLLSSGSQQAHLWPLPTTGPEFWRIDGEGFTWISRDDYLDGLGGPNIYMNHGHVYDMSGNLVRSNSSISPYLILHGTGDTFSIVTKSFLYNNTTDAGSFKGLWDFERAEVKIDGVLVPEPSTWALMILGFGAAGAMIRHRNRAASDLTAAS